MPFEMICSACKARLLVADDMIGREVRCPSCRARLRVPEPRRRRRPDSPREPAPQHECEPPPDLDPDGPDELERRPRHRGPPPSGRSPLFILAALLGTLFVGTFACCGGGYLLLPGENWRRHESGAGGFAVDLPAAAKKDFPIPGLKPEPGQQAEGAVLWKRGEVYAVVYVDVPPPGLRARADEDLLDGAVNELRTDPECRLLRADPVTVSGFPGREVEFVADDGGTYVARFLIADRTFYVITAGGRFAHPGNANVRRFIDSFEVTDPPARGAARRGAK